jgi:hypothetical protein
MTDEPHPDDHDEPQDPFHEQWPSRWQKHMSEADRLWQALVELPTVEAAARALDNMAPVDLQRVVLERLYAWHYTHDQEGRQGFPGDAWLDPLDHS